MSEALGPWLIGLAAMVAALSYVYRLRSLSSEERQAEIRAGMERARPFVGMWAAKAVPLWLLAFMGVGALGYVGYANLGPGPGPAGGGVLSIFRRGGGTSPTAAVGAPNTPSGVVTVSPDTNSVIVIGSAFVGSGADTHDSTETQVFRVANNMSGAALLSGLNPGPYVRDTITSNDSLKADTTYKARMRYRGASGDWSAWSAPDTFVNTVAAGNLWFFSNWDTGADSAGTDEGVLTDNGKWDGLSSGSPLPRILRVVPSSDFCGGTFPTDNVMTFTETGGGDNHVVLDIPFFANQTDFRVRAFFCSDWAITSNGFHSPSIGIDSPFCWTAALRGSGGEWAWALFSGPEGSMGTGRWNLSSYLLDPDTWYRWEIYFRFIGPGEFQIRYYVYDMDGDLVYDSDDMFEEGASAESLEDAYQANNNIVLDTSNCDGLYWGIGEDDFGTAAWGTGHSMGMTAVAVDTIQPDQPIGSVIP